MGTAHYKSSIPKENSREIIIPFDEILEGLQKNIPEGFTTAEMAEATGMSPSLCRKKIKALGLSGRLEYAGRKPVMAIDGVTRPVPVYRLVLE